MSELPRHLHPHWQPGDYHAAARIVATLFRQVDVSDPEARHPVIQAFQALIDRDAVVRMLMTTMIDQIPAPYKEHHPRTLDQLLAQLNALLAVAPAYIPPEGPERTVALVGTPFSALLIWTMGTPAGFEAYRHPAINAMFKRLLGVWSHFLDSEASRAVLNGTPTGWLCPEAQAQLTMAEYEHDEAAPHWGFASWNAFFTRRFRVLAKITWPIAHGAGQARQGGRPKGDRVSLEGAQRRMAQAAAMRPKGWRPSARLALSVPLDDEPHRPAGPS